MYSYNFASFQDSDVVGNGHRVLFRKDYVDWGWAFLGLNGPFDTLNNSVYFDVGVRDEQMVVCRIELFSLFWVSLVFRIGPFLLSSGLGTLFTLVISDYFYMKVVPSFSL